jgi:hypothetical protein
MSDHLMTFSGNTIEIPPMSLVIDMTALDEISERAQGFKEIVLNVDGEMHHYRTEDVLEILRGIEL